MEELPKLSNSIINKDILRNIPDEYKKVIKEEFNILEIDEKLKNTLFFIIITKKLMYKNQYREVRNFLLETLKDFGVKTDIINIYREFLLQEDIVEHEDKYNDIIGKNKYIGGKESYKNLFIELKKYSEMRGGTINEGVWNKFIYMVKAIDQLKNEDLLKMKNNAISSLKETYKNYANEEQFSYKTGRKYACKVNDRPKRFWTKEAYIKNMELAMKVESNNLYNKTIVWIAENNNVLITDVSEFTKIVEDVIIGINKIIAKVLFNKEEAVKFASRNRANLEMVQKINEENINEFIKNKLRNVQILRDRMEDIRSMEILDSKINKLDPSISPLMKNVYNTINSEMSNWDKQNAIEKAVINYDTEFFKSYIDNPGNKILILVREYKTIMEYYDNWIKKYTMNRYNEFKKLYQKEKNSDYALMVTSILYLGRDKVINIVYSELLNRVLSNNEENTVNRTSLIEILAKKVIVYIISMAEDAVKTGTFARFCTFEDLKDKLRKERKNNEFILNFGELLYRLITTQSDVFKQTLIKHKDRSDSVVYINSEYINEFMNSSVTMTQFPMICEPRKFDIEKPENSYFPYLSATLNTLYIDNGRVLKSKFDQINQTEGSNVFYKAVEYLNSVRFKINNQMLNYVIEEWNNSDSYLFNGRNKIKQINSDDKPLLKKEKIAHNSKFQLYSNIINIAMLYRNQVLYFPVFGDFRGRLYTLSNYLSFQGNDLSRSLLLFDEDQNITKEGEDILNIYFASLGGFDKKSLNSRKEESHKLLKTF